MKKLCIFSLYLLFIPQIIWAQSSVMKINDGIIFVSGDDTYQAGSSVNLGSDIIDDFYGAGGVVNISKNVGQDIVAAGGTIIVSGNVGDDVRVAGGNVIIEGNIGGDLILAGGQVQVRKGVIISGNIIINGGNILFDGDAVGDGYINGGDLNLGGTIGGNANVNMNNINIGTGARISGNLLYSSPKVSSDLERITTGTKQFNMQKYSNQDRGGILKFVLGYLLYRFLFLIIFGSLLYFFFENLFKNAGINLQDRPGLSFLYGLLYFILMPFLILFLFITIIGIPVALLFLATYIFSFVFYKLLIVLVFSAFFIERYLEDKKSFWKKFGIIVLISLFITPWAFIDLIVALFAFGALFQGKMEMIKDKKKIVNI